MCGVFSSKKYKGYCYRCFIHEFPDSPLVRYHKTKERAVLDYLQTEYPDLTMMMDKPIEGGCSKKRPDVFIDLGDRTLVVEIDENQHQAYDCSCENRRLMELFQDGGNRPLVMVRFNPDGYFDVNAKRINSCWSVTAEKGLLRVSPRKEKEWADRLRALSDTIRMVLQMEGPYKEVDVFHLFYDQNLAR